MNCAILVSTHYVYVSKKNLVAEEKESEREGKGEGEGVPLLSITLCSVGRLDL